MTTEEILQEMKMMRDWSNGTYANYELAVQSYEKDTGMTLNQLIDEADEEEEKGIRMKRRKIKQHLQHFIQTNKNHLKSSSLRKRVEIISSIYKYHEIECPHINIPLRISEERIEDIPTRQHIKQAILSTNNKRIRALICFMASSGCGSAEARNITIQDMMEATKDYHQEITVQNWIQKLKKTNNIIPIIQAERQKTKTRYYMFCTPEAMEYIINYLEDRMYNEEITPSDKLFPYSRQGIVQLFERINTRNNWGKVDTYNFFRAHSLRKFFATTLTKVRVDFLITEFLLGHKVNKTTAAYYKLDPQALKIEYMKIMTELTFFGDIHYSDIESQEKKELELLREKTRNQEERLRTIEQILRQGKIKEVEL